MTSGGGGAEGGAKTAVRRPAGSAGAGGLLLAGGAATLFGGVAVAVPVAVPVALATPHGDHVQGHAEGACADGVEPLDRVPELVAGGPALADHDDGAVRLAGDQRGVGDREQRR